MCFRPAVFFGDRCGVGDRRYDLPAVPYRAASLFVRPLEMLRAFLAYLCRPCSCRLVWARAAATVPKVPCGVQRRLPGARHRLHPSLTALLRGTGTPEVLIRCSASLYALSSRQGRAELSRRFMLFVSFPRLVLCSVF